MSNIDQAILENAPPAPTYILNIGLNLPVTSSFALPLAGYYTWLQARVVQNRIRAKKSIAHGEEGPLYAAFRAQANFAENVPLALVLAALVEANGGSKRVVTAALSTLVLARLAHAEFGIMNVDNNYFGRGRQVGFFGSVSVTLGLAGYGFWLVRGYWGL